MYRGTYAIVDLAAIRQNVAAVRSQLRPGVRLLVTVKANGYGHGAEAVARAALAAGATDLGVACLEEALALRQAGIAAPILVLGATPQTAAPVAARHRVALTVGGDWDWDKVPPLPARLSVHLKVDSGMARLGVRTAEEAVAAARALAARPDVSWDGVFTHLACADADDLAHAAAQMDRFRSVCQALADAGLRPPLWHAANSAATLRRPDWQGGMVRIGIAAYGYHPGGTWRLPVRLVPALHLCSFVTRTAVIAAGETVGYGATFTARRPTRVATVAAGYADGYPRALSNRADALVHGERARVIGNVCMDQSMLDVTHLPGVARGDAVTLYGAPAPPGLHADDWAALPAESRLAWLGEVWTRWLDACRQDLAAARADAPSGGCARHAGRDARPGGIFLDELAGLAGTIAYELMCALSPRVPRIYVGA
ncbi:hypothetical protein GCM10010885_11590 [Alicyclobacillus cellulosilyticus]|uniref:Alanine racemase n=1 Tax=Alicyclobacillus cellulosilyticus TaxID=1003997 RepID=A0A917NIW8_9BACL|nr:alanine racemase [Alicyclobacillus cellulosilyticus]GGJ04014.1 hypothetical protein GCM10010885_11590 [Alicyclobacillus cellulosilyticus]